MPFPVTTTAQFDLQLYVEDDGITRSPACGVFASLQRQGSSHRLRSVMARYSTDGLYSSMYPTSAKERMLASSCRKVNGQSAACPATDAAMLEGGQCASSSSNQMRRARSVESKEDSMLAAGGAMMMDHGGAGVVRCDMNSHNANRFSGRGDKLSEIRSSLEPYASGDPPGRHPMKLNEESLHVLMQMGFDQVRCQLLPVMVDNFFFDFETA